MHLRHTDQDTGQYIFGIGMLFQLDNPDLQHILVCSLEHFQSFQVDKNNHICLHWFLEVENRAHMGLVSKDLLPQQVQLNQNNC